MYAVDHHVWGYIHLLYCKKNLKNPIQLEVIKSDSDPTTHRFQKPCHFPVKKKMDHKIVKVNKKQFVYTV